MDDIQGNDGSANDNAEQRASTASSDTVQAHQESHSIGRAASILTTAASTAAVLAAGWRVFRDDGGGWLGRRQRRSPLTTLVLVGTGVTIGAGTALLLAPWSGRELRKLVRDRLNPKVEGSEAETPSEGSRVVSDPQPGVGANSGVPV